MRARITGVATYPPERTVTSAESDGFAPPPTLVERTTGIRAGHMQPPDLAAREAAGWRLEDAVGAVGSEIFRNALEKTGLTWEDFAVVCVHQGTLPYLEMLRGALGIPASKLVVTLPAHGNVASATLPPQLATALEQGCCGPGDRVALIGPAGGISLGAVFAEL